MLLNIQDYREHLPSNTVTDSSRFAAFETRVLFRYLMRYLGNDLLLKLVAQEPDPELLEAVKPALVNLTYLESIPFFNLVLTSTGYGVVSNANVSPASMERVRDLKEGCLEAGNTGISRLLCWLEENKPPEWNQCSLNPGSLIGDSETFNQVTGLEVPKVVFVDVIPHLRNVETLQVSRLISPEFVQEMAEGADLMVKPLLQKGLGYGAYHYFIYQPIFNKQGNPVPQEPKYDRLSELYLKQAQDCLVNNLSLYPTFAKYGYEAPYDNAGNPDSGFFIGGYTA